MRNDEPPDAWLAAVRRLPVAGPGAARDAHIRARCHAVLKTTREGKGRRRAHVETVVDLLLAAGAGVYAAAVFVEALRLVWR